MGANLNGESCMSALMWIHESKIPNKAAILNAAVVSTVDRDGNEVRVSLAEEVGDYIVTAKHLFSDWSDKIGPYETPSLLFEDAGFVNHEHIVPWSPAQKKAWEAFSAQENGVLNLACGKGKTVLALKKIAQRNVPALVLVNNTALLNQWIRRATDEKFLNLPRSSVGVVQGPKGQWDRPLVIAMIQTACNRIPDLSFEVRSRFGTIIWDEAHRLAAPKFVQTASVFYGARFGLTATPERADGREGIYMAHIGKTFYTDLETDMPARTFFKRLPVSVNMSDRRILDVRGEFSRGKYHIFLSEMRNRNRAILHEVATALKGGRRVIVLCHAAQHPGILGDMAKADKRFDGYDIGLIEQKTKGPERLDVLDRCNPIFSSFEIAKEGLDAPSLDTLYFASPFKTWIGFQQGKGRVERFHPDKKDPIVVYFEDTGSPVSKAMCNFIRGEMRARGLTYKTI